ncbi:Ig-like domain-containing protein, partial [Pontibacter toksunensis]
MVFSTIFVASAQFLTFHHTPAKILGIITELKIANAAGLSNIVLDEPYTGSRAAINKNIPGALLEIKDNKLTTAEKKEQSEATVAAFSYKATLAGFGGPILVIHAASNPFSLYPAEILLAEGLNQYATSDISAVSAEMLSSYDVVIVGNIPLTDAHVTMLSSWTNAGGTLIALKPDVKLAQLLGLVSAGGTLANKYILVNTTSGPGKGIVNQTIQYQGTADYYTLNGATRLATLYSAANTATTYPAVTMRAVGDKGGTAVAFTYDLARSIVYTRQGNPAWSGQERDGQPGPIRSNDQFYPDWVDLNKVMIPQADEQQRLLANIITMQSRKPVPRFWYLPRGLKAAVVMTGDDHGNGGTKARFNQYMQLSSDNSAEAVADWRAIRGTSYIYPNTPITDAEAKDFEQKGFEVALHLSTNCANYTATSLERDLTDQLAAFSSRYPSVAAPTTNRTHCIAWSDWNTQPQLEAPKGIRLDANYYYWPSPWVQDRPGMFTGSGIPMRFTDLNGVLIDCYQLTTQMTDESDQTFPYTIDQLLNKALGAEGYYGVFCANMHTDADFSSGSDAIISSAKSRNVPVISSKQLLTWLDGRNGSYFSNMIWDGSALNFSVSVASGARSLQGMLPITGTTGRLLSIKLNGATVNFTTEIIKGIEYAFFPCSTGSYVATYDVNAEPNQEPVVSITAPADNAVYEAPASITITASASDGDGTIAKVEFYQGNILLGVDSNGGDGWSYGWSNVAAGTYSLTARATDNQGAVATSAARTVKVTAVCPCTVFKPGDAPGGNLYYDNQGIQLGMKFRSTESGYITGVRFYKQSGNSGTHIGQLHSSTGTLLAQATFTNETASGWQQVLFSSPVAISANTTYVVSYHSSAGYYSATNSGLATAITNGPLKGLANGEDGSNGVYRYTGTPAFPTSSYQASNYWVDVVFNTSTTSNQSPSVAITSPANNATYTAPATISIAATASDTDGTVSKVEFFSGTTKLGEDLTSPYSYSWSGVAAGTYSLTARATDNGNAVTTSAAVTVTVSAAANQAPSVAITSPANNATYTAPATIDIAATASDTDGTVSKVEFFSGTTKLGEDLTSPYSYSWSGVAAGTYSLTARATDNGNAVTTSA